MDKIIGHIIIYIVVALIIDFIIAYVFSNVAEEKGHSKTKYFWICFLFGVIGCILVAALPDLVLRERVEALERKTAAKEDARPAVPSAKPAPAEEAPAAPKKSDVPPAPCVPQKTGDGKIVCPACGCEQRIGRSVCWLCGAKFLPDETAPAGEH